MLQHLYFAFKSVSMILVHDLIMKFTVMFNMSMYVMRILELKGRWV